MKTKITISRINVKNINGQYGPTRKFDLLGQDNTWYSCFEKRGYTDSLKVGDTIEIEVVEKQGNDGRVYKNIQWPKEVSQGSQMPNTAQLTEILNRQASMEKTLNKIVGLLEATLPYENTGGEYQGGEEPPLPDETPF